MRKAIYMIRKIIEIQRQDMKVSTLAARDSFVSWRTWADESLALLSFMIISALYLVLETLSIIVTERSGSPDTKHWIMDAKIKSTIALLYIFSFIYIVIVCTFSYKVRVLKRLKGHDLFQIESQQQLRLFILFIIGYLLTGFCYSLELLPHEKDFEV